MSTLGRSGYGERGPGRRSWGVTIVSDLHLSRHCDPHHAGHDLHDAGFARFLDHVRRRAAERCSNWRLVILGDLVDLPDAGAPPGEAIAELTRVATGHPQLLRAVGAFMAAGLQIDVVAGNHDVALLRSAVRERLAELIPAGDGGTGVPGSMAFHPWIFHIPGVLYAEHGSQYHDITAVPALLGLDGGKDRRPAGQPLIAELERYRGRLRERRTRPGQAAALVGAGQESLRFAAVLARQALALSGPELARRRDRYHGLTLRQYATQVGITHDTLVGIDDLTAASAWSIATRLVRTWVVGPSVRAARNLSVGRGRSPDPLWQPADRAAYLRSAWPAIHHLLRAAGQAVPFYVFGHTHHAEELPLVDGTARYLNTGTWKMSPERTAPAPGTFVEITGEPGTIEPVAKLLRWNDELGHPQALSPVDGAHEAW
jgi:UDP-2,3-diacylglucosamine pyrophosphatase LpxH